MELNQKYYSMDRGHLVPNSDFDDKEDKLRSFLIINRAPQYVGLVYCNVSQLFSFKLEQRRQSTDNNSDIRRR